MTGMVPSGAAYAPGGPLAPDAPLRWQRTPYGYLSSDSRWFIERGGEWEGPRGGVDPTRHLWLVWRRADQPGDYDTTDGAVYGLDGKVVRPMSEVTGRADDDETLFVSVFEDGWLADAKATIETARAEETP